MALRDFDKVQERMMLRIEVRHIVQLLLLFLVASAGAFYVGYRVGWNAGKAECPKIPLLAPLPKATAVALPVAPTPESAPLVPAAVGADAGATDDDPAVTDAVDAAAPAQTDAASETDAATGTDAAATTDAMVAKAAAPDVATPPDVSARADVPVRADAVDAATAKTADAAAKPVAATKPTAGEDPAAESDDKPEIERQKPAVAAQGKPATPRQTKPAQQVEAPIAPKVKYVIQIKAFRNETEASTFAKSLQDKGHPVVVTTIEVPGKGQFWRVRMGPFDTLDEARSAQRKFEAAEGHTTMILASP